MLTQPASMDECVYFTNRSLNSGKIKAWVLRGLCPKCNKGLMGKPRDPKTGKPKTRAEEYACPECSYSLNELEYEDTLQASIQYTCPHCSNPGETQIPFKRKKVQIFNEEKAKKETKEVLRFQCSKCNQNIDITKKMR